MFGNQDLKDSDQVYSHVKNHIGRDWFIEDEIISREEINNILTFLGKNKVDAPHYEISKLNE